MITHQVSEHERVCLRHATALFVIVTHIINKIGHATHQMSMININCNSYFKIILEIFTRALKGVYRRASTVHHYTHTHNIIRQGGGGFGK